MTWNSIRPARRVDWQRAIDHPADHTWGAKSIIYLPAEVDERCLYLLKNFRPVLRSFFTAQLIKHFPDKFFVLRFNSVVVFLPVVVWIVIADYLPEKVVLLHSNLH